MACGLMRRSIISHTLRVRAKFKSPIWLPRQPNFREDNGERSYVNTRPCTGLSASGLIPLWKRLRSDRGSGGDFRAWAFITVQDLQ
jgi:hypothetical protein